jgi:hypothetical protein
MMRRLARIVVASLAVGSFVVGGAPGGRVAAPAGRFPYEAGRLADVAAVAPDDAWIVGHRTNRAGRPRTLTEHWNGSRWTRIDSPTPWWRGGHLTSVAARASDVWAAGYSTLRSGDAPLILRWDGAGWGVVPTPAWARGTRLVQVAAGGGGRIWFLAVDGSRERAMLLVTGHGSWRRIPVPRELRAGARAFAPVGRRGAWVVGSSAFGDEALAARWSGDRWTVERLPDVPGRNLLAQAVTMSRRGPLVVGASWIDVASDLGPRWYVTRRARGRWIVELRGGGWLHDVAVAGGVEWTVGQARPAFVTAALRHRPSGWLRERTPAGADGYLVAVDAWRGGAWAVGWNETGTPDLALRWNGREWHRELTAAI